MTEGPIIGNISFFQTSIWLIIFYVSKQQVLRCINLSNPLWTATW